MKRADRLAQYVGNRTLLCPSKRTFVLNLGFGKCGSTTLQSMVLPFLPIDSYSYSGRHYKVDLEGNKLYADKRHGDIFSLIERKTFSPLPKLINKAFDEANCVCFSAEILPADLESAIEIAKLLTQNIRPDIELIYLFNVRHARAALLSGYLHSLNQYYRKENQLYSVNDVIFDSEEVAFQFGFKQQDFFDKGSKRPLPLQHYRYAYIINEFLKNTSKKGSAFVVDVNVITSSQRFWRDIFSKICGSSVPIDSNILHRWMEFLDSQGPVNSTSSTRDSVPYAYRAINAINEKKLEAIEFQNISNYGRMGEYYS